MVNINTNLSAFIAQKSLTNSTKLLNQAIERMTTGLKINGAKDNTANYAITEKMTTQLNSLDVAEDNTAQGVDIVTTANETLDLINERFTRLRHLAVQAENKTYGEESLKAINLECKALTEEIKRIYQEAEYNGIKIFGDEFFETVATSATSPVTFSATPAPASAEFATEDTTLQELGIGDSNFQIYNSNNELIESYDTEKTDTLGDIFQVLSNYGISSSITDGVITISSSNGRYVNGELMNALGIDLEQSDFVSSSAQDSNTALYYTTTMTATEATTLADIGALTSGTDVVKIKDKYGDDLASFNVSSTTTLGGLFNSLGNYGIQGEIDDGVITLSSADGNYVVSQGAIANMGIGNAESSSAVTTGTSQTSSGVVTYETVTASAGEVVTVQQEQTITIWTTTTTSQTVTSTIWTTTTSSETRTETIWTTTTTSTTTTKQVETVATTYVQKTDTLMITTSAAGSDVTVVESQRVSNVSSFSNGETYYITDVADLVALADLTNSGVDTTGAIFELAADIDLGAYCDESIAAGNGGWTPIGHNNDDDPSTFAGTFNGNGHVISNLKIERYDRYQGLFGYIGPSGVINYLKLEDVNITGGDDTGGLAGGSEGTIDNCYVTGEITGSSSTGGVVGSAGGAINNSYSGATVTGYNYVGGLVGYSGIITINNCYTTGDVTAEENNAGGLVGYSNESTINTCYATGDVYTVGDHSGGLIGEAIESTISNCYATGFAQSNGDGASGLVGGADYSTISNCYSTGDCLAGDDVGGIVGEYSDSDVTINNCASVQSDSYGNATEMTEEEIKATYTPESMGFTEANGWTIVDDTPVLTWQLPQTITTTVTADTTLGEALGENGTTLGWVEANGELYMYDTTFSEFINGINSSGNGMTAELRDGVLTITGPTMLFDPDNSVGVLYNANVTETSYTNTTTQSVTETVWATTTSSTTQTETIWTTTTTSTTNTETVWETTTASTTQTQTVDVTQTLDAVMTTANVSITSATSFAELGLASRAYITAMNDSTRTIITIKTADTVGSLMTKLNNAGITASLANGELSISSSDKKIYISGMSDTLKDIFKLDSDFYSTSFGVEMTDSNIFIFDGETTVRQTTSLSEIGVTSGELVIKKDGQEHSTVVVSESQTIDELLVELNNAGFDAKCTNGVISLKADGDMVLAESTSNSSNAISLFRLGSVQQTIDSTYANKDSSELNKLAEIVNSYWKSTSDITLQVGPYDDEHSRIEISTGFTIHNLDRFANIGKKMVNQLDYIAELDNILATINEKQTKLGAAENRLMSVLEEISIKYDNLVSSRSTLRDADIAEETSIYIQQQILQQAGATLLSVVANQTPQLALQLL